MTAFVCDVAWNGYYGNQWVVIFDGEMWEIFGIEFSWSTSCERRLKGGNLGVRDV